MCRKALGKSRFTELPSSDRAGILPHDRDGFKNFDGWLDVVADHRPIQGFRAPVVGSSEAHGGTTPGASERQNPLASVTTFIRIFTSHMIYAISRDPSRQLPPRRLETVDQLGVGSWDRRLLSNGVIDRIGITTRARFHSKATSPWIRTIKEKLPSYTEYRTTITYTEYSVTPRTRSPFSSCTKFFRPVLRLFLLAGARMSEIHPKIRRARTS